MVTISCNCFKQTLTIIKTLSAVSIFIILFSIGSANACITTLKGKAIQGGLIIFSAKNASHIMLDGRPVSINQKSGFVVGFHRDDVDSRNITARCQDGSEFKLTPAEFAQQHDDLINEGANFGFNMNNPNGFNVNTRQATFGLSDADENHPTIINFRGTTLFRFAEIV